jgi:integrase
MNRGSISISQWVDDYELERGLSGGSVIQYCRAASSLEEFVGGPVPVASLCREMVNHWLKWLAECELAPSTVKNRRTHLLALWRGAAEAGLIEKPTRIRRVTVPFQAPVAWTADEARRILSAAQKMPGRYGMIYGLPRAAVWEMLVRLAWNTGLRQGDVFRLRYDGVASDGLIAPTQNKTGRWLPCRLTSSTMECIDRWKSPVRERIVPWSYTTEHFRHEFAGVVATAGLSGSFKRIRKSAASNVERRFPGCGSTFLGHARGSNIGPLHYFDPRIITPVLPVPEDL